MTRRDFGTRITCARRGALCAVAGPVDATSVKNIVRVHGACFDCSGLKPVDEMLVKGGYHVRVVQKPLASLKVASTRRVVALQPGPRILVARSYGGTVATEAGREPRVVGRCACAEDDFATNLDRKQEAAMGQVTTLARALAKTPPSQVDPSHGMTLYPREIAESAQRAMSACQTFGPFHFFPARLLLLEEEMPVRLGSRALEILAALVERPGELVSKDELTRRVWPNTVVEESNLKVNVAALRRALGEGQPGRRYIATVSGRGYCFVAPVEHAEPGTPSMRQGTAAERAHNLPASSTRTIGRADTIRTLLGHLQRHRLVTIVGPGGIGKTTVALAAAETRIAAYRHGVWLVDLALLADPQFLPSAVASGLGLKIHSENVLAWLTACLRDKQMLIILDSCEHAIDAVASLAEQIIGCGIGVHILATSREPLRAKAELVHRLSPLASPPASSGLTAAEALTFPAIQLFVERAAESLGGFELSDADAPIVAEICQKLEGIALAIELTATRIDAFGVKGLSDLLEGRFRLLRQGRRTAMSRHRTLAAALDWSYGFLPEDERVILRRLSIFAGSFTLEAANAVTADTAIAVPEVAEGVANLVAKSLVSADISGALAHYRLLNITRAYALEKLTESGEHGTLARRHAEYFCDVLSRPKRNGRRGRQPNELADCGRQIDNLRAALDEAHAWTEQTESRWPAAESLRASS